MPNIIEQQDLLKGLPDTRLAMLLQNPVGDIPPFLVAAEAQRRQAIRQQFAGSENKESVVDSLTKQIANVPQNIGAKTSPTEEVPDLKGILEKNQEIQDQISSQQEKDASQSMASGGIVRRFAGGGVASLAPKGTYYGFSSGIPAQTALGSLARASSVIPQTMGVMPGNIGYQAKPAQPQQPPQPQQMRGGGMVQRYQSQGLVERMGSRYGARAPTMQELTTMTPEELAALRKFQSDERMRRLNQQAQITGGRYGQGIAFQRELLENQIMGPFSEFASPESAVEAAKRLQDLPTEEEMAQTLETGEPLPSTVAPRISPTLPPGASGGMSMTFQPRAPAAPAETLTPEPGETPDEFRARYEELLAAQQPSDWERAQRYFAMAEQFLDPSKTTMQSIAGAGQAFAQSAAEQARAQREAELNLKKGLLEYDIGKVEEARKERERELESKAALRKETADIATRRLDDLERRQQNIYERIKNIQLEVEKQALDPVVAENIIKTLQAQYDAIGVEKSSYNTLLREQYGFKNAEEYDPDKLSLQSSRT